jgi:hypothetical protein
VVSTTDLRSLRKKSRRAMTDHELLDKVSAQLSSKMENIQIVVVYLMVVLLRGSLQLIVSMSTDMYPPVSAILEIILEILLHSCSNLSMSRCYRSATESTIHFLLFTASVYLAGTSYTCFYVGLRTHGTCKGQNRQEVCCFSSTTFYKKCTV